MFSRFLEIPEFPLILWFFKKYFKNNPLMQSGATFLTSSIGKKIIMAVTGLILLGFVIGHMLGNLQIFIGQEQINAYAATLHGMPVLLWLARIGLLIAFVVHIWVAVVLTLENMKARPRNYLRDGTIQATYASRTMRWSGVIILAFVIYHLMHFTVQVLDPEFTKLLDEAGRHDVYGMMIAGFSSFWVSGFYIVAMLLLALHLGHGVSSLFQ